MTKPTLYICGPMAGLPERNFPAFIAAAKALRAAGYEVVNPAELHGPVELLTDADRPACLRRDILHLVKHCEGIALLPNWPMSKGATLEVNIGREVGMEVKPLELWLELAG